MIIKSKQNPLIKEYKKLQNKKYRKEKQQFLLEGFNLISEAKKYTNVITLESSKDLIYKDSIRVDYEIIKHLSETKSPQSIIGVASFLKPTNKINKTVILNNVSDPGNIGTILRSALAFEFDTVIIENIDIYNPKIIRSSLGAIFSNLNIISTSNLEEILKDLKAQNFKLYYTLLDVNAKKLNEVSFDNEKIAVVVGNEANGIDKNLIKYASEKVYIPIAFESLNVASALAIILNKIRNK
ncbi:TrmH family RNA methyltransferase [Mycoplasmopsis synoviae]|uniref:tRNA/rRNA methyltransferase n=2 Tax=Mycoplasmopsis synoviae TaxID=2109 RepID=A0A3B0PWI7_MYCSY|nr:RNA methyltransferase [Mycoplasmopsis synoviae]AAZ43977.2 putative tRNA/rRNA methyltransferase [Mycoplasmopsis synoviae 53]AKB11292.1 rRNA methyltransferase [Mycoplasmopsis synoviae ATCC 25204]UBX97519.1 RNA methyltransferase [Mycoplasmopsis synoviae]UBX98202.1 RNA methyltransferase [Mycoplasmopsis synoviae]UBX98558.1 RNA methyltransferase [Mycoplasmopsis synoviae]